MASSSQDMDMDSLIKQYYQRLFPFESTYSWLSYGNVEKGYFARREFSYSLKSDSGEDIYSRFNSYADLEAFSKGIKEAKRILKIDIGAVYNAPPKDRLSYGKAFIPLEKELVFDIDMTDYDEIRKCCSEAKICPKCWPFMTIAIKVLHHILKEDFGFSHILWVYSGRRGVHCWVADSRARKLPQEIRSAIVQYMSVITGGENKSRKVELGTTLHPTLKKAYQEVLLPWFEKHILVEQGLLMDEESQKKILAAIPDATLREGILKEWSSDNTTDQLQKWYDLKETVQEFLNKNKKQLINPIYDIVFTHTYPRLDVNVSHGLNHLLKAPFCVHPSTGRICVPIDLDDPVDFDPFTVPTVQQLISEIDQFPSEDVNSKKLKDYKKTSLKKYVEFFKKSFLHPLQGSIREEQKKQHSEQITQAISMDF